ERASAYAGSLWRNEGRRRRARRGLAAKRMWSARRRLLPLIDLREHQKRIDILRRRHDGPVGQVLVELPQGAERHLALFHHGVDGPGDHLHLAEVAMTHGRL